MSRYQVRNLDPSDYATLMKLEIEIFGGDGEDVLGPYYVRLCCDFYNDTCFIVTHDGEPAGYILGFMRDRDAYCTTPAVTPKFQGTRAVHYLLRAFCQAVAPRADSCWFTVKEDNAAARAVHATLGAREVGVRKDFYGPGEDRIVSVIERDVFARLARRYKRLGFAENADSAAAPPDSRPMLLLGGRRGEVVPARYVEAS